MFRYIILLVVNYRKKYLKENYKKDNVTLLEEK
jgi:hypothetical protein